ncbi:MAG TPA: hypothetical protein VE264_00355 [Nitrososphaera sp.]|nr:hypothetical protein [Nitrososphaera sp.]
MREGRNWRSLQDSTLVSVDRLTLISEIAIEKSILNYLTAKLSVTSQEASKHLMRHRDAKVIERRILTGTSVLPPLAGSGCGLSRALSGRYFV